jgi:hypothetical protein
MWIESHQELRGHFKTRRLERLLGISTAQAVGHLHMLWWWALDHAPDGDLERFTDVDIADACGWDGNPADIANALINAGFIDQDNMLHDWQDYGAKFLNRRFQARIRQQKHRAAADSEGDVTRESRVTNDVSRVTERDSHAGHAYTGTGTGTESTPPISPPKAKKEKKEPTEKADEKEQRFQAFLAAYGPTNAAIPTARNAWNKLSRANQQLAMENLPYWTALTSWQSGYKPYPQKWLNGEQYKRRPEVAPKKAADRWVSQADLNKGGTGKVVT